MTSKKMFSSDLQRKFHSAFMTLNALNQKEPQKIISILKCQSNMNELNIASQMGVHNSSIHTHLQTLHEARLLILDEQADETFFSLNHQRLAKISRIVNRLTQ